jgi:2'-hydroxyisoflavone reductase
MEILFLGGTSFVGRHTAEAALERGHSVTLFHRGKTGPELFPDSEHLLGDRTASLQALAGRSWDVVIDVCGFVPLDVRRAGLALRRSVAVYCYVSTVSAYSVPATAPVTEDSALWTAGDLDDPETQVVDARTYGPLKALCELTATEVFDERLLIVRPTYVAGPHDPTDRFTHWVRRAAGASELLVVGPAEAPIQLIDVRDLAAFTVKLVEAGATGAFNAVGPAGALTWERMIDACVLTAGVGSSATWVDASFVRDHAEEPATAAPLWRDPADDTLMRCSAEKSIAAGLMLRPLEETIADTLAWDESCGRPALRTGLTAEREAQLLAAWRVSS